MYRMKPTNPRADYQAFKEHNYPKQQGKILTFLGVDGYDVYNCSVPFVLDGKRVMAGRVEPRENAKARIMLFEETSQGWQLIPDAFVFHGMEDPFVTTIDGQVILGGVHVNWRANGELITFHTDFYRMDSLSHPVHVLQGPSFMKDIRLLQLPDKRIAAFTRPSGDHVHSPGKRSAIGVVIVDNFLELTQEVITNAPLIEWAFADDFWGGANQLHNLKNGKIGMIGHESWGEQVDGTHMLHYYSMAAVLDPAAQTITPFTIISARECFPQGPGKRADLVDVCFTSGIERLGDGTALMYSGLSDAQEGVIRIDDPFAKYEN